MSQNGDFLKVAQEDQCATCEGGPACADCREDLHPCTGEADCPCDSCCGVDIPRAPETRQRLDTGLVPTLEEARRRGLRRSVKVDPRDAAFAPTVAPVRVIVGAESKQGYAQKSAIVYVERCDPDAGEIRPRGKVPVAVAWYPAADSWATPEAFSLWRAHRKQRADAAAARMAEKIERAEKRAAKAYADADAHEDRADAHRAKAEKALIEAEKHGAMADAHAAQGEDLDAARRRARECKARAQYHSANAAEKASRAKADAKRAEALARAAESEALRAECA